MKKIEVFKTNVRDATQAGRLVSALLLHFPESRINVDMKDCDRILRVEGRDFNPEKVISLAQAHGVDCVILD